MSNSAPDTILSILTSVRNDQSGLEKTAKSIAVQESDLVEHVVWDGASTDGTTGVVERLSTIKKYRWSSGLDGGIYDGMNKALMMANGKYCIFLNAGDELCPDSLSFLVNTLMSTQSDVVLCDGFYVDGNSKVIKVARGLDYVKRGMPAIHQAIAFKTDILKGAPYDTSFRLCGDYALMCKLYRRGASCEIQHRSICYHYAGGATYRSPVTIVRETYNVQRYILKHGALVCAGKALLRFAILYKKVVFHRLRMWNSHAK